MKFLDINLTKDSSYSRSPLLTDFKENPTLLLLKNQKSAKQENSRLFMNSILQNGKMRVEKQSKTREESILCPETSTKKFRSRIPSLVWILHFLIKFKIIVPYRIFSLYAEQNNAQGFAQLQCHYCPGFSIYNKYIKYLFKKSCYLAQLAESQFPPGE